MQKETKFRGRVWKIVDSAGNFIDDIDTDQIYHNAHLAVTDINKMGQHSFGNLEGWTDFPQKVQKGDIILVGENFGAGSSRQHAVDCFASLGVSLIIAGSYGAIYKRNAINSGLPIITHPQYKNIKVNNGDIIEVDLVTSKITNITTGEEMPSGEPFSGVQMDIYMTGNLFEYAKSGR